MDAKDARETTVNVTKAQRIMIHVLAASADVKNADIVDDMLYVFKQALKQPKPSDPRLRKIQAQYHRAISILNGADQNAEP